MTTTVRAPDGNGMTLILGCGFTGTVLAQKLCFDGRPVVGSTRSHDRALVIRSRGAEPVMLDISDLTPLKRLSGRIDAVVSCIPPRKAEDGTWVDGHGAILEFLKDENIRSFVYVSATSVWGNADGAQITEKTPVSPDSPRGEIRVAVEQQIMNSGLPAMVVRAAGIYGPGRSMLHRLAKRNYKLVGEGSALSNRVHVRDLVRIIEAAMDRGTAGSTYLAADGNPSTQAELVNWARAQYDLPEPRNIPLGEARIRMTPSVYRMVTGSKRLDSTGTLDALGLKLRYPTFQKGLTGIWQREAPQIKALIAESE